MVDVPDDATVVIDNLHVRYHVAGPRRPRLKDMFTRREDGTSGGRVIHAVRGIDLVAREGEAIGLIGSNGSGKSTTLAAVAGLLPPSEGDVLSVAQPVLLGVNAALESNLTGRRNTELGCLALGMSPEEAEERFDEIVAFAELEEFIDLPMKAYSSGMRARLHFAIATAIEPEILLIDEALSVGDERFRHKSERRIQQLLGSAGTVFIVSHSLASLRKACSRVVWIERGQVVEDGDPDRIIGRYRRKNA